MRLSISARVSIACSSVIVMALALLAIGLSVGNKIHQADLRITMLSDALGQEDRLDQAQRRLRQDIGRLTRDAERGVSCECHDGTDLLHDRMFGISTPQASVDLRDYRAGLEEGVRYDSTAKAFAPDRSFRPRFLKPSADRLLLQLRAWLTGALPRRDLWFRTVPPIDMAPDIARHVDPDCLRILLTAIRSRSAVEVEYQSLTNSRWRAIAPHALAFDGFRWHVRAYACDKGDFRDFVLSRIAALGPMAPVTYDPADDLEWHTRTRLRLIPHPGLSSDKRAAVERDYSMTDGTREIEVRLSMAYYSIMRMNLDLADLAPERAQVRLENLTEVQAAVETARAEARRRADASAGL